MLFFGSSILNVKTFVVTSGSMVPKYPVGSLIYVKDVEPVDIKVGDTITFRMKNSEIVATHEVYEIDYENEQFYTQGINNKNSAGEIIHDAEPVSFKDFIGKPSLCIPYLGYVNFIITQKPGSYILISITFVILIISFLLNRERSVKK